ncbi:CYTH domain-containing protein [Actinobacillus delphinicola]|uniref:Adenylate cyclase n=1 Tax=Actinobacillus delphinicola TaxID=51161 RepID=A0A448TS38_9PAST|nr:CYTH domain-containing protein [Actinobacillus delphinicola]VEJ08820.1 adenylate cyclase [Actinobacillus delphinicola]
MKNNEIELKLRLRPDFLFKLSANLESYNNYSQKQQTLINTYYDTPDLALSRQKSILRIRKIKNQFILTIKLAGQVTGGLHSHPEYNIDLPDDKLDLTALQKKFALTLPCKQEELSPLFQTNFTRKLWLIPYRAAQIELALDEGEIISPRASEKDIICELEFELKEGKPIDILSFVYHFSSDNGAMLSATNKATRGYWLALDNHAQMDDYLAQWEKVLTLPQDQQIPAILAFEQDIVENAWRLGKTYFSQDFTRTVQLISAFFNLYTYITDVKMGQYLIANLEYLAPEILQAFSPTLVHDFASFNQYAYQQIQQIMQEHSQDRNNDKAVQALWDWLYCNVQLKRLIIEMLIVLNEKNKEK